MDTRRMDQLLASMTPKEIRDGLWMIDVFERWSMPSDETDEWRRRILARQRFLALEADSRPH